MNLADVAMLSDCQSAALVDREGEVVWWCPPRFDAASVFGRLLDPNAGHWSIRPRGNFRVQRAYLDDTLILRTEFTTPSGRMALTDALALEPGAREHAIGEAVPGMLVRHVEVLQGEVEVDLEFAPRPAYGLVRPHLRRTDGGIMLRTGPVTLALTSSIPLQVDGATAAAQTRMTAGESASFALEFRATYSAGEERSRPDVPTLIEETRRSWCSWMDLHQAYDGHATEDVRRDALVLQGLTYQPSGGVVAAVTTSLPEVVGGEANWDYRFVWLRDLSLTMQALWVAACPDEAERFLGLIAAAVGVLPPDGPQIMYTVDGGRILAEDTLDHLRGYQGSRPVRVGNAAWKQRQIDVLGEVIDAAHRLQDQIGEFEPVTRSLLVEMADQAAHVWREPDAGMWEARDAKRHYTTSKVWCWVALDRAIAMAERLHASHRVDDWQDARDAIRHAVLEQAWSDKAGAYAGAFGSDQLDASVLLLPLIGFLPATDERMRATIDTIEQRLGRGWVVRRWEAEPNGFVLCNFWLVECLALAGEMERAAAWFERTSGYANDLGLFAEMIEPDTGTLLGNIPQAFSHIARVNAAWRLTQCGPHHQSK